MAQRRAARDVCKPNLVTLSSLLQILAVAFWIRPEASDPEENCMTGGMTSAKADAKTIRVFVGSEPEQNLAVRLLDCSIRKTTAENVAVVPLHSMLGGPRAASGRTAF